MQHDHTHSEPINGDHLVGEDPYDPEAQSASLLAAFEARYTPSAPSVPATTGVLESASFIASNAIDVHIPMLGIQSAACRLHKLMLQRPYSPATWHSHELHPSLDDMSEEDLVNFIFTMDLLNFSFWSDREDDDPERWAIEYRGRRWTGYWGLVAALRRAIDEAGGESAVGETAAQTISEDEAFAKEDAVGGTEAKEVFTEATSTEESAVAEHDAMDTITARSSTDESTTKHLILPITNPLLWTSPTFTISHFQHIFRSATTEPLPLLQARFDILRQAGFILASHFSSSIPTLLHTAGTSATHLINTLTSSFLSCFSDTHTLDSRPVYFHKRAQILAADLWACFSLYPDSDIGKWEDVDSITMFADYRIPQMLHTLGCLVYSPSLEARVRRKEVLESGGRWEVEIRGCSVWAVECLRREIGRLEDVTMAEEEEGQGEGSNERLRVNAILIDFFLYDLTKEMEAEEKRKREARLAEASGGGQQEFEQQDAGMIPHHRTRSIWY